MKILKQTYTQNNNEIVLIESDNDQGTFNKTVLVIGVVHGDEPQGKFLIENYLQQPCSLGTKGKNRLLFIPCLNPDGMVNNTRQNASMVDLNRNFPTKNWGKIVSDKPDYFGGESAASEIETKFITEIIQEFTPDVILTIHAPFKVVNYDGPAKEIAEKISEIINYPAQCDIGYPTPGSFGTYAGVERNIPTITLELDEETDVQNLIVPINQIFSYLTSVD